MEFLSKKSFCRSGMIFAISEFLFFIAQRFGTEVSECGVLLDNEC